MSSIAVSINSFDVLNTYENIFSNNLFYLKKCIQDMLGYIGVPNIFMRKKTTYINQVLNHWAVVAPLIFLLT